MKAFNKHNNGLVTTQTWPVPHFYFLLGHLRKKKIFFKHVRVQIDLKVKHTLFQRASPFNLQIRSAGGKKWKVEPPPRITARRASSWSWPNTPRNVAKHAGSLGRRASEHQHSALYRLSLSLCVDLQMEHELCNPVVFSPASPIDGQQQPVCVDVGCIRLHRNVFDNNPDSPLAREFIPGSVISRGLDAASQLLRIDD